MATNKDESLFVKAYKDEGIEFKSFESSKRRADSCENSSFSLMRGLAQNRADLNGDGILGSTPAVKDSSSVLDLIHGRSKSVKESLADSADNRVNLVDVARPLRNRSSIHAFLSQNVSDDVYEQDYQMTRPADSTVLPGTAAYGAPAAPNSRYSSLFRSNGQSEFSQNKSNDSLQDIYKRILECQ